MLYVSRRVGSSAICVVDTDDSVETTITVGELSDVIQEYDIPIVGVNVYRSGMGSFIESIDVYQPPETLSQLQLKMKMLRHVDVKVFGSCVTSVTWNADKITSPVTVRLSDFGTSCAARLLSGNVNAGEHRITLVLDDKISIDPDSFTFGTGDFGIGEDMGKTSMGVVLDLRELTDELTAKLIYMSLYETAFQLDESSMFRSVIDSPERQYRMLDMIDQYNEENLEDEFCEEEVW